VPPLAFPFTFRGLVLGRCVQVAQTLQLRIHIGEFVWPDHPCRHGVKQIHHAPLIFSDELLDDRRHFHPIDGSQGMLETADLRDTDRSIVQQLDHAANEVGLQKRHVA
jgi:hypothetical protein